MSIHNNCLVYDKTRQRGSNMIQGIKDLSTLEPCQEKIFPKFVQCINCLTYRVKNMMQAFKNQLHHNLVRIVST